MARHILKCSACGRYTMEPVCSCGGKAVPARPPKYSVPDKYARYRRAVKKEGLLKEGLL